MTTWRSCLRPSPGANDGGRFAGGDPAIAFDNPLDPASLAGAVIVSPAPAQVANLVQLSDDATSIAIDPYALDPDTTYAVTVAASVKDVFGQTLGKPQTVTVRTGDFAPGAWAPSGTSVIPAGSSVALNFYATNLPGDRYQTAYARLTPEKPARRRRSARVAAGIVELAVPDVEPARNATCKASCACRFKRNSAARSARSPTDSARRSTRRIRRRA